MNSNYYLVADNAFKTVCTWKLQAEVVVTHTCNYSTEHWRAEIGRSPIMRQSELYSKTQYQIE